MTPGRGAPGDGKPFLFGGGGGRKRRGGCHTTPDPRPVPPVRLQVAESCRYRVAPSAAQPPPPLPTLGGHRWAVTESFGHPWVAPRWAPLGGTVALLRPGALGGAPPPQLCDHRPTRSYWGGGVAGRGSGGGGAGSICSPVAATFGSRSAQGGPFCPRPPPPLYISTPPPHISSSIPGWGGGEGGGGPALRSPLALPRPLLTPGLLHFRLFQAWGRRGAPGGGAGGGKG